MPKQDAPSLEQVLQDLYDSEINVSISWMWDAGFDLKLGGNPGMQPENWSISTTVDTAAEIAPDLIINACSEYPKSVFAKKYASIAKTLE